MSASSDTMTATAGGGEGGSTRRRDNVGDLTCGGDDGAYQIHQPKQSTAGDRVGPVPILKQRFILEHGASSVETRQSETKSMQLCRELMRFLVMQTAELP